MTDGPRPPQTPDAGPPSPEGSKPRATKRPAPLWKDAIPPTADLTDPLALNSIAHAALGIAMIQVLQSKGTKLADRVEMLCQITGRMAPLTPMSRLYAAEQLVRGEGEQMKNPAGPKMEEVTPRAEETSTEPPAPRGVTARRGTPRRRPLG